MKAERRAETFLFLMLLAGLVVLPVFVESWRLLDVAIYLIYGLFAASLAFIWGHVGLLCLGQAVFFGLGAYAMSFLSLGKVPGLEGVVSTWAGLVFAAGVATLAGVLLGLFIFRARGLHGAFFGVVTLAVAVVAEKLFINWNAAGGMNGLVGVPSFRPGLNGGAEVTGELTIYAISVIALGVGLGLLLWVQRSPFGRVLAAIRSNEARALAFGYDVAGRKTLAFAVSAGVAGIAGALFVTQFNFASPSLIGFNLSLEALIWVALGGRRSVVTGALGAIAFRFAETSLSGVVGETWLLIVGAFFVGVVVLFPDGLFGSVQKRLAHFITARASH